MGNSAGKLIEAAKAGDADCVHRCLARGSSVDETDEDGWTALMHSAARGDMGMVRLLLNSGASVNKKDNDGKTALFSAADCNKESLEAIRALAELDVNNNEMYNVRRVALFAAVFERQVKILQVLVESGADMNEKNNDEETALFYVARRDNVRVVRTLIELGASPNVKNIPGETALFYAARYGNVDAIRTLIELGASPSEKSIPGETALFYAARYDSVNAIRTLIELGASPNEKNILGETALFYAARYDSVNAIRTLIELGASPNEKKRLGKTALFYAARYDSVNAIRILIELGASPNEKNNDEETALFYVARRDNVRVVRTLIELGASPNEKNRLGKTALFVAAENDKVNVIRTLIELGASVNVKNKEGKTALFYATRRDNVRVVRTLIELGASSNEKRVSMHVALMDAARYGNVNTIRTLIELGASSNKNHISMDTALFVAAENNKVNVIRTLIELGASANAKSIPGETALFYAARYGNVDAIRTLIELGASANVKNKEGKTALVVAVENGNESAVRALINFGAAPVDEKNQYGRTALHLAAANGDTIIIRTLVECGACLNEKDNWGETALLIAADWNKVNAVQTLVGLGAVVSETNSSGETALCVAARTGKNKAIKALIELKADVNHLTPEMDCPVLLVGRAGNMKSFRVLIEAGASVNVRGRDGETPLISASRSNYFDGIQLIIKYARNTVPSSEASDGQLSLLSGTLETLKTSCASTHEFEPMFSRLVTRLEDVSAMQDGLESHLLTLVTITFRLCSFLLKYKSSKKDHPLSRFIASRVIASKVRDFHEELDHFIDFSGTKRDVGPHVTWQEQWREDRLDQQGTFQDLLRDDSVLTQGLADSEQRVEIEEEEEERKMQHTDILFQLQYELRTCETEGDTDMCTQIQDFMDRLVGLVNLNPPVVPEWFVSSDDVDFHERNLVDDSFTKQYHGTWKKASVMVVLLDPKKYDFEVRATKWFSLRHPNIVALYGACHVTNPPFLVYEYVPDEISLEDFLKVGSNRHLVWEKLYEAALALNYLHQNRVAHGRLGDKNIVISRNGQVKVGNLEVDGSYYWGPPEQFRQNVTESPASNIFSFGICILKVTSDGWRFYDTAKTFLDGRIPERVPNLNGEQWDLVVQMCAYEPHDRVDIAYVVNQLKIFAMKYGNTNRAPDYEANAGCAVNQNIDFEKCKYPGTTDTIRSELESIIPMLSLHSEVQWIKESVYPALQYIYKCCVESRLQPTDPAVIQYCDLLARIKDYVRVALSKESIALLARSQKVAERHHVIFAELDRILDMLQVPPDDPIRSWERNDSDIDKQVLQHDRFIQDTSVIGPKNEAVTLTHPKPQNESPLWDPTGRPMLSDTPPPWYLALRDVQFKQTDSIGEGAFGTVYKGTWRDTPVVVKFMGYEEDAGTVSTKLFLHEVRVWHELNHPHIIKLFGANHCDKRYFVCEFASNGDLLTYLKRNNCSISDKWKKMYEITLGLQYMHERNIVHNDLKCDNILVGANGDVKIMDFGLSCIPGVAEILVDKAKMGAVNWKSPEYLRGERPSIETDIYSLAMCILEVLTGDVPWGKNMVPAMVRYKVKKGNIPNRPTMMSDKQWNLIELMTKADRTQRVKASFVVDKLLEIVNSGESNDLEADSS